MKVLLMGQEETYLGNVLVIQVSAFILVRKPVRRKFLQKLGYTDLILHPGHSMHSLILSITPLSLWSDTIKVQEMPARY